MQKFDEGPDSGDYSGVPEDPCPPAFTVPLSSWHAATLQTPSLLHPTVMGVAHSSLRLLLPRQLFPPVTPLLRLAATEVSFCLGINTTF